MSSAKCPVNYFLNSKGQLVWQCPNRMGVPTIHSANTPRCWRYNCKGAKPPSQFMFCNAHGCNNIKKNHKDSKYCSDKCSSRERTRRWRMKKNQS